MSGSGVRVRFAPSPTGFFHVGSARTALFNWLFARQQAGSFLLRVEDTDAERNRPEWIEMIFTSMQWLGLDWDGEPVYQSQRSELYAKAARRLFADGHAYYCKCTRDDVEARTKGNATPGYDGFCRDRGLGPDSGGALRFRTPREGSTVVVDLIRGEPVFEHATIEDFVVLRSNGTPIFILANVVDDVDMAISHVVRGEDHLPNTPKYLLLWSALGGGDVPVFAHLPLLVNAQRQKLSKRRDKVALEDYREQGFLPEAMVNYLALLGWAPGGDRELLTREELVAEFRLDEVNNSPAFFDERKLAHFNQHYIAAMPVTAFVDAAERYLPPHIDRGALETLAPLVQERVRTLAEVPDMVGFLFVDEVPVDEKAWDKRVVRGAAAAEILDAALAEYESCSWDVETLHDVTAAVGERFSLGLGKAQFPIRVAVMGRDVGPPLFESLVVLGRERTLARLRRARERLATT
ncbi:MAG TPA: glutamate--tRNA ligase [Acidimicrobiales bacterium]|nr:glutamate--tRNA ligase [Acidimicrobiales bacterium]